MKNECGRQRSCREIWKAAVPHGINKTEAKQPPFLCVAQTSFNVASVLIRRSSVESALAALAGTSDSELATTY